MKTVSEFMDKMTNYFDGVKNKTVAEYIVEELRYVRPGDLDGLFRQLALSQPASWKPDLKSITEAIKACKLDLMNDPGSESKCPVCGTVNHSTGICPVCCYRPEKDGTPAEHLAWWNDWKAGKEPHFDIAGLLAGLAEKKAVRE